MNIGKNLLDALEKYARIIGVISTIFSVLAFQRDNRLLNYLLLAVGYLFLAFPLWKVITERASGSILVSEQVRSKVRPPLAHSQGDRRKASGMLGGITLAALILCGFYLRQDLSKLEPPVKPAQEGELLILISNFGHGGNPQQPDEYETARKIKVALQGIQSVRAEIWPGDPIRKEEASEIGKRARASLVIWGTYFPDQYLEVHYLNLNRPEQIVQPEMPAITASLAESYHAKFNEYVIEKLPQAIQYICEFVVGQVYYLSGEDEKSLSHFDEALTIYEDFARTGLAGIPPPATPQAGAGQPSGAANTVHLSPLEDWGVEYAYFYRGLLRQRLGNIAGAINDYKSAVQINPAFAEAHNNLGNLYQTTGKYEWAEAEFTGAISYGLDLARFNRGNMRLKLGKFDQAIQDYDDALEIMPEGIHAQVYFNRGQALLESCRFTQAVQDFTTALEKFDPLEKSQEIALAYIGRGVSRIRLGQYSQAILDCQAALERDHDEPLAYYNLAAAQSMAGDVKTAIDNLVKAISLVPDLKASAACDPDFEPIREQPGFPNVSPPSSGCPASACP
jgi:tetratricopeptide (TPR) repeat protein